MVYPGRYYENVRFNGKNITLASLELITGNRDYIYSTIIDGNQSGPVVRTTTGETNIRIRGFTITNGSGDYIANYDMTVGGGVIISHMAGQRSAAITNCHITGNQATNGGGFWGGVCYLTLSGVSIHDNQASLGGGMYFEGSYAPSYNTSYDPVNRCSIYSNYAANGSDMYYYNTNSVHVIVDTFTVANPWNFYATAIPSNSNISNPYTFDILNTVHQEVNHDLYVAPWGDDANSGLSASDPMKSVFMAMYRIASDSNDPKTVHVANGYYSPSLNGQLFPIPVKSYTRLVGESKGGVILDASRSTSAIRIPPGSLSCLVSSFVLTNAHSGVAANHSTDCYIDNIDVQNVTSPNNAIGISLGSISGIAELKDVNINEAYSENMSNGLISYEQSGKLILRNVNISNVVGNQRMMTIEVSTRDECDVVIDGCNIHDNSNYSPEIFNTLFQIAPFSSYGTRLRIEMKNTAFYDNYQALPAQMGMARALNDTLFIENCTFAGNTGGSSTIAVQGTSVLTNNIFYNPAMGTQVWIPDYVSSGINSHTTLRYNNILGGLSGVLNSTTQNPLIWREGNTAEDPLFSYAGNRPYTLSAMSPLIDSGWQYSSGLAEPGFDAGGNERLMDGDGDGTAVIDKGAYEYQPLNVPQNLSATLWENQLQLSWEMPAVTRGLSGYRVYRNYVSHADVSGAQNTWFREQLTLADTLVYQVAALYGNVESARSDSVVVIAPGVDSSDDLIPAVPTLSVGPNPFTDIAVIRYTLPQAANVELSVYNLRGQKVRTLELGIKASGEHVLAWEGCDDNARPVADGIYLLRLALEDKEPLNRKIVLIQ